MGMKLLSVFLALVAAGSNATSNVIQRITNKDEGNVRTLSLRLVVDLLHRPLWFAAIGAVTASFVLQAAALRFGPLAMVEPLLVCELPLTFVGAAVVLHAPLGRREWTAAVVMTGGLAALVYFLDPHAGTPKTVSPLVWVVGLGASACSVGALVLAGWRSSGDRRAASYGAATGIMFGTTAALMKGAVAHVSAPESLFTSWETYAMVLAGILAMYLVQNAMQAGKIVAAQPGITLLDPVVAIVWGVVGFGEQTASGAVHLGLSAGGGALMVLGALLLSRSPVLEHGRESPGTTAQTSGGERRAAEGAVP
ncbi:MAG: DMT family transporter [Acidimicrobiales bacterium]